MTLRLTCLGEFQITRNGEPFTAIPTDKVRALLVYLAVEGRVHTRSELVQLFWPGYTAESANNNLRQSLHRLRNLLHEDEQTPWLLTTRQNVQINPAAAIGVDVTTFTGLLAECRNHAHAQLAECPVCLARLQQAVDLYQGDFLTGFTVADSDGFEEWRRITQEQLHLQTLDALALLAEAAETASDDEGALQHARRQLTLESWLEAAHRRIMRILARRGQNAAAIAQYNRCRQVLAEEMGSEPETETTALYEQIRSGQFPTTRATERATPPPQRPATQRPEPTDGPRREAGSDAPQPPINQHPEAVKAAPVPPQLPALLGRDAELAQIATLLAHPNCRLVTLVGPPGVGKTRLAQALLELPTNAGTLDPLKTAAPGRGWVELVQAKIQNRSLEQAPGGREGLKFDPLKFDQGIHFIDLSTLRDPALLAATLAQALTAAEPALQLTGERLIEQLRDKAMLLVLDTFEQVLPGAALLGQLLAACRQIKVLATSRVPLHLPGEQVVMVHPLPLPEPDGGALGAITLAIAAQNVAVQLFCQRAAVAVPGFTLTEQLAPVVAAICRRLDGLPLAIELAAARIRLLPPPALLERLTTALPARLELLSSGSSALSPRQQTLRAAIAWSYDLLNDAEQQLFRQLTVFVGGATLPAIEAVIGAGQAHALFDNIESLIDKSLLRQLEAPTTGSAPGADAEPRLVMLDTLREYGWALLTASASDQQIQQHHADYFLAFAETAAPQLHGTAQVTWLDRLALDHDNLRAALDWLAQAGELPKALRLATALRYFWRVRGHYREGSARLQQLLARPEAAAAGGPADAVRARALNAAGYLQWVQGNTAVAQSLLQAALSLGRAVPDPAATAFALRYLGLAADAQQDKGTARRYLEESLAIYRSVDTPNETALALMYLGDMALGQQSYDQAQQLYQESADLLRQLGNQVVLPYALRHLGYLALIGNNLAEALRLCTESLRLNLAAGEQQGSAAALSALAAVAVAGKRWSQAARLVECVTTWLAASQARLLPFDHTYYTETQRRLHQHQSTTANNAPMPATAPLTLTQALTYVVQELVFDDEPGRQEEKKTRRQEDRKTGREEDKEQVPSKGPFLSPPLLVSPSPVPPHNLPSFATPLVGRDQALAELAVRLQQPGVRLLTLVGLGGMGKTRLAVAAGEARLAAFADGVWFVPLAPIHSAEALPGAIATALGITLQGGEPRQALLQSLRAQQLLLILDNYEQLLLEETAVDLVVDLLARAPGVQILVTSRQRLNLRGEQLYPVQTLTVPSTVTLAEATSASAVRLFVQAAQRVQADFQLTATNLPAVLRICQLVEGMPLGLELAAANASSAPLRAIADALEQSAEILAVEWRDLPARQRSMRAVFAWSWQLLSAAEQRVLRQCARFRSGFDYTAAQAVIGATPVLLTALVNKSLLQWQAGTPDEGRYIMHELLRQFAAEALAESDERTVVEERHGRYYLAYLAARGFRLGRGEPKEASAEIQVELDNVRLAWHWAATQGELAELDQALYAWWQFCLLQGLEGEARQSLAAALAGVRTHLAHQADDARLRQMGTRLLAKLLALHANCLFAQGHDEEMAAQAREAMQLGAASGGFEGEILGTYVLGRVLQDAEQKREAQTLWEQALQLIGRHQPQQPENELLHELHWMAHIMLRGSALHFGDYAGCRAHIVEALRICQTLGKQRGELTCLSCLGEINFFLYDFAAAEADYQAELALGRSLGYRLSEMSAQEGLARIARLRGDYATARTLLEQSLSTATELAFHYDEALFLAALIRLHCQLGDQTAAAAGQARLTQLLAQVQLGKECRLYGYLAAAFKAHYAGDKDTALAAAEEANQINQQGGEILFRLVDTALILGHVRAAAGQWEAAQSAFQEALTAFQQFTGTHGVQALSAEPQAGLAQIALAQGDRGGALAQIEALLPVLAQEPHAGYNDPFFIYLTGYRVLAANRDPRAATLLQQGYDLLQQDAAALDEESRERFLTNVTTHRDLVEAYKAMQAMHDKVTSDSVTSTSSVTESPSHPVTQSPPHLVTQAPLLDWAEMPMVDFFVERTAEMAQLTAWLTLGVAGGVPAQLISILGMGGMGKTTLAAAVTKAVAPTFAVVIWRSLLNAPPLGEIVRNWLQILSRQTLTALPESLDEQLRLLLSYLQQERCLLILDNVESIFAADESQSRAGVTRPGYEGYDQLFQRLASSDHQSCLLLTSREQPYALLRSGRQAQTAGRVQVLPLAGLDQTAGQVLLASNGLNASAGEAAQLVENYSGNPLALQIVAATIADFFGGDIAAFQQEEGQLFDGMRLVLDQQFARLSPLEREILVWLAIEREPITVPLLRSNFVHPVATAPLLEALQALQNRSLLEKRDTGLTLQNVIIEYMTEYLVAQVCREISDDQVTRLALTGWQGDRVTEESSVTLSFLNRFALLKAQSKAYVRQSQARLILQPVAQQLLRQLGQPSLLARCQEVLHLLRKDAPRTPGYAAGNLLNLLLALDIDVTDYDFSNLCVWQPYLREKTLPHFNFTNADLRGAAFTDTFDIVRTLAYSPDGRLLAAGTSDGEIRLWRAADGQLLANGKGHGDIVSWLCFLDDGKTLISYSHDLALVVWQVGPDATNAMDGEAGEVVTLRLLYRNNELSNLTNLVAFHPQEELLVFGTERGWLSLWHLGTRRRLSEQTLNIGQIHAFRFSSDGKTLAMGASDRRIHLWDVDARTGRLGLRQSLVETPSIARDLSFRADGRTLASGHEDGAIYLWALDAAGHCVTGQAYQVLTGHRAGVWRLVFSPDDQLLASASDDHSVRLWAMGAGPVAGAGKPVARFDDHRGWVRSLAFSPDGHALASAGADRTVRVWDLRSAQLLYTLYGYVRSVKSLAFCPNSRLLISGSDDQHVRLWDVTDGRALQTWAGHSNFIWQVAVSPDGRLVASAGDDRKIYLRDASNGQVYKILSGHDGGATAVAFSPDSTLLASGGLDCRVILWDVQEPAGRVAPIHTWDAGTQVVWTVVFSPNGEYLAFGGEPNRVRIWHLPTQQFLPALENATGVLRSLAFSPDSRWLAAGGYDAIVYLWQMGSAAPPILLRGHQHRIRSVAFSPDGRRLATASFDHSVRLWDLQSQTQIHTLLGHSNQVLAVAFSADGAWLASASEDESIRLWHGKTGEPLAVLPIPGPYVGMRIDGVTGISAAQKAALKALGAVDEAEDDRVTNDKVTESPPHPVTPSPLLDWAEMPMVDFFVERRTEMAQLTGWLAPTAVGGASARLVSILGMGGMGKTTLAAAVTKAVAPSFAVVIWRSLLNAPPLNELVRNWLQILSRQTLTALPESLDEQLRLLLSYLQQERCLLILDNVESIFAADESQSRAGVTRPGYEGYDQLFQRLASSDHQSCLLLTSREQPYALLRSGRQAQTAGRVQVLPLAGLDQTAGQVLLASNGLNASATEAAQLVENYSGNPLALQIVAATIADFFGGDVAAFQQEEGNLFDGLRLVLDQQFARLSPLERDILVWLAIEREAITVPMLRSNFVQPHPGTRTAPLLEALQALQNRSLLEQRDAGFALQNVIIEYTTEYLVEQVCQEIYELQKASPLATSFLNRFALIKAQAKQYVRQSQARLILQPVADRLVTRLGRAQLVARLPQLLDALRAAGVQKGYAGGNLLNLLVYLGEELIGYDFSHLPVWQADLSGLTFVNADFTGADLEHSTFTVGIIVDSVAFQPTGELWVAGLENGVLGLWRTVEGQLTDAFQHRGNLRGPLVFSPNGQLLATDADDYRIRIWSTNNGECLQTLDVHQSTLYTLAFNNDGTRLASCSSGRLVRLWDLHTGRCVQQLGGYDQGADALAFSPDGQLLATGGGDGLIQLWDTRSTAETGRRVAAWQAHRQPLGALAFSPDGRWLASGSHAGEIQLWEIAPIAAEQSQESTGEAVAARHYRAGPICQGHTSIIRVLRFVPTADLAVYLLASASADRTVRIWSLTGQLRYTLLGHTNALHSLSVSPDGQQLVSTGNDKQIVLWDVTTGQAIHSQQAYRSALLCLAFSPDGQTLACGGADHIVRLWSVDQDAHPPFAAMEATESSVVQPLVEGSQIRHFLQGHTHFLCSVAFSPDGQTIASSDADRTIRLWNRATGQALQTMREHQGSVRTLAFAPAPSLLPQGAALLASAGADRIIRLWAVSTQQHHEMRGWRQLVGHEDEILTLVFDQHGRHLVSGCADGSIGIWDVQRAVMLHQLTGHTAPVTTIAIHPTDNIIASSSFDQTIRLWDLTTGACLQVERGAQIGTDALAFSPDGQYIAYAGNDFAIYLWPWRTTVTPILPPTPLRGHMGSVNALSFSPTAACLASCSDDGTIRLWDVESKSCRQVLRPPGPYAGMKISGVTGISAAQKAALKALGAVDEAEDDKVTSDKVTSDKVTSDKVTESPNHPVTPSPSHLVTPSPLLDWAEMPVVDFFVERRAEVAQLTAWLAPTTAGGVPVQLISILGMGGMGKTTLAAAVTKAVAPTFAVVIWRSLLNAPPLSELLRNWLHLLTRQRLTTLPDALDDQLRLLLTYLQQERCLLVLDNVESIFADGTAGRAGVTRPGYEGYDQLFQRLASSEHQSCLLLTSREQPYALLRIATGQGRQAQTAARLQVLTLAGLDQAAGQVLLASNGLHASAAEVAQLVENYSGNPLALQIVAATIADFFGGDVAAFQQEEGQLFDGMRLVLDQQFARLSPLEREILIWLAIEREPVTVPMLRANFVQPVTTAPLLEALQALQNRSLLEKRDSGLTLQNVIIEYTTEYLVEQICQEIVDDKVTGWQGDKMISPSTVTLSPPHPVTLSFLNRFALLKAGAKEYVRQSQSRLIVEPVVTRLRNRLGRTDLAQPIRALITRLKERPDPGERGYAAGNLLNLLIAAGVELTRYDLSALTIWQAYLRTATLYDVNFAGADLTRSEFADTFATITALTYSPDGRLLLGGTSTGDIRVWLANSLQPVGMLQGHSRIVMGLAVGSAQSQLLASCSEDGAVRLWNLAKLDDSSLILYKTTGIVCTVAISPVADLVASAGDDPAIQVWDAGTRRLLAILRGHTHVVTAVAFTPDGRYLASCSGDHTVRLWDVSAIYQPAPATPHLIDNSQVIYQWPPAAEDVAQITISPDGQWLAGVQRDSTVWRWQMDAALSSKPVQILQKQGVHHSTLRFNKDSSLLAVASLAKTIWLLDSRSGEVVQQLEGHTLLTNAMSFSPDGQTLASSGSDRVLRVWELATGRASQAVAGAARAFRDAVFAADGQTLVTCGADRTIRIWEISETAAAATGAVTITGHCRHTLQGHSSGIWTVAVDTTCQVVASAGEDCNILLWDRRTGRLLHKLQGHRYTVTALAFSPDGQTLVSGSPDQTVRLWNYRTYQPLVELRDDSQSTSVHEQSIWCVALSPDGATVAAGYSDGSIVLWDIRDLAHCRQISKLRKHAGWVRKVAFSPDGALLASGSNDQTVRIWDVAASELRAECKGHTDWVMSVAFHPDGQRLASGGYDNTIRLWDVTTGELIVAPASVTNPMTDPTPMRHNKGVMAVTFHPQGHLLLSASQDERMTFWQVAKQQKVQSLIAPGPYSGLNITGVTGISEAQKAALRALGAVEE